MDFYGFTAEFCGFRIETGLFVRASFLHSNPVDKSVTGESPFETREFREQPVQIMRGARPESV